MLPLVRGHDDGNWASCSDAGILTFVLPEGKPSNVAYYWFRVVEGEFPDAVVPDAKLKPVEVESKRLGFRFVWLDLAVGHTQLVPFDATIEIRAISHRGVVSEPAIINVAHPGGDADPQR